MRYENEKCPVCGNVFTENDDVVVCPECATPHHRHCYLETGKCANENLHSEGFVWQKTEKTKEVEVSSEAADNTNTVICPQCGAECSKRALICANCGGILNEDIQKEFEPHKSSVYINGLPVNDNDFVDEDSTVTVKDAACFIQRGKESYIKTFLDAKVSKRRPKFNISALVFGPYWFFFRKIYKAGFAFAGAILAIQCFMMAFFARAFNPAIQFLMENAEVYMSGSLEQAALEQYASIINDCIAANNKEIIAIFCLYVLMLVVNIVAGFLANKLYLEHIKSIVGKIRKIVPNVGAYYTYLYAKGGTTILNTFLIGMAIYYLNQFILSYAIM